METVAHVENTHAFQIARREKTHAGCLDSLERLSGIGTPILGLEVHLYPNREVLPSGIEESQISKLSGVSPMRAIARHVPLKKQR